MEQNKRYSTLARLAAWPIVIIMALLMAALGLVTIMCLSAGIKGAIKETWKWAAVMLPISIIPGLLTRAAYKALLNAYNIAASPPQPPDEDAAPAGEKAPGPGAKLAPALILLACLGVCGWFFIHKLAEIQTKASEGATVGNLGALRSAIQSYYGDNRGRFPADLKEALQYFSPGYRNEMPFAQTAPHGRNSAIQYISGDDYRAGKFTDTGGWAYVNTPEDKDWGTIVVNCTHTYYKREQPWTTY